MDGPNLLLVLRDEISTIGEEDVPILALGPELFKFMRDETDKIVCIRAVIS